MHVTATIEKAKPATFTLAFNRLIGRAQDAYASERLSLDQPLPRHWRVAFSAGFRTGYAGGDAVEAAGAFKAEHPRPPDGWLGIFGEGVTAGEEQAAKEFADAS